MHQLLGLQPRDRVHNFYELSEAALLDQLLGRGVLNIFKRQQYLNFVIA
jgi:hypothetical protein